MYTAATIAALAGSTFALSSYAAVPSAPGSYAPPAFTPASYASASSATVSYTPASSAPPSYSAGSSSAGWSSAPVPSAGASSYASGSQPPVYGGSSSVTHSYSSTPSGGYGHSSYSSSPSGTFGYSSYSSSPAGYSYSSSSSYGYPTTYSSSVMYDRFSWRVSGVSTYLPSSIPSSYPGQPGHPSGPGGWGPPSNHPSGPGNNPSGPGGWTPPSGPGNGCPVDSSKYCLSYEDSEEAADVFRKLIQNYSDELALEYLSEDFVDYSSSVAIIINGGDGEPLDIEKPTFVGRQAFMDAQGSQPEIPFKKLQRFHGCNSVSMRWLTRRSANGQPTETAQIPVVGNVLIEVVQSNPGDAHNFRIKTIFSEFNSAAWLVNLGVFVPENGTEGDAGNKRAIPVDLRGPVI